MQIKREIDSETGAEREGGKSIATTGGNLEVHKNTMQVE